MPHAYHLGFQKESTSIVDVDYLQLNLNFISLIMSFTSIISYLHIQFCIGFL